jgi:NDP-sugar pyrophosphorylase family protein
MDTGNPQTYLYTNWDVLRRWSFPYFPKATEDHNNIWFDGVKPNLSSGARIDPPTALGSNIQIGENSVIGSQSVIGNNSVIMASVLWNDVIIGNNVKIDDSIICNNVIIPDDSILSSGTVIAPNIQYKKPLVTLEGEVIVERKIED